MNYDLTNIGDNADDNICYNVYDNVEDIVYDNVRDNVWIIVGFNFIGIPNNP